MKVSSLKYEDLTNEIIDRMLYEGISDDGLNGDEYKRKYTRITTSIR